MKSHVKFERGDNMNELRIETSLSMEEIEENTRNIDLLAGLQDTLEEIKAYQRGEEVPGLVVHERTLPDVDAAQVRKSLSLTQRAFAAILGVSCRTVEAWESGRSNPTPTARKLMYLIQEDHSLLAKLQ